jgi:hypothetical protein
MIGTKRLHGPFVDVIGVQTLEVNPSKALSNTSRTTKQVDGCEPLLLIDAPL